MKNEKLEALLVEDAASSVELAEQFAINQTTVFRCLHTLGKKKYRFHIFLSLNDPNVLLATDSTSTK